MLSICYSTYIVPKSKIAVLSFRYYFHPFPFVRFPLVSFACGGAHGNESPCAGRQSSSVPAGDDAFHVIGESRNPCCGRNGERAGRPIASGGDQAGCSSNCAG